MYYILVVYIEPGIFHYLGVFCAGLSLVLRKVIVRYEPRSNTLSSRQPLLGNIIMVVVVVVVFV